MAIKIQLIENDFLDRLLGTSGLQISTISNHYCTVIFLTNKSNTFKVYFKNREEKKNDILVNRN